MDTFRNRKKRCTLLWVKQMCLFLKWLSFIKNKATVSYPYSNVSEAPTIEKFCQIYKEESEVEGVKSRGRFCTGNDGNWVFEVRWRC